MRKKRQRTGGSAGAKVLQPCGRCPTSLNAREEALTRGGEAIAKRLRDLRARRDTGELADWEREFLEAWEEGLIREPTGRRRGGSWCDDEWRRQRRRCPRSSPPYELALLSTSWCAHAGVNFLKCSSKFDNEPRLPENVNIFLHTKTSSPSGCFTPALFTGCGGDRKP